MASLFAGISALSTTNVAVHQNAFRAARMNRFMSIVDQVLAIKRACSIVDIGGTVAYWLAAEAMWGHKNVILTVVNLMKFEDTHPKVTQVIGNACDLSQFQDYSFDIAHSNSVIEHVGRWSEKDLVAREIRRVARRYFVQTPAMWFPIEPHYRAPCVHWLPPQVRAHLLMRFRMGFYQRAATFAEAMMTTQDAELLSFPEMQALFPDAVVERERFLGMTKSLIAIR